MSIKETKDGVLLSIFVKPNSPTFSIQLDGDEILVHATEEPEKGKVNKEILKELTRLFQTRVELVSGSTSREKKILIVKVSKQQVKQILNQT